MNAIRKYLQCSLEHTQRKDEEFKDKAREDVAYHGRQMGFYLNWLMNVKMWLHKAAYRRALGMLIQMPKEFCEVYNRFDVELIRLRCIMKIIAHKASKYAADYRENRLKEKKAMHFWVNQLYFSLNHLILEVRPDINAGLDLAKEEVRNQIEYTVVFLMDSLYQLIGFSYQSGDIGETCAYFAMAQRVEGFIPFCRNPRTLQSFQQISLLRTKVAIKNADYDNALYLIEKTLLLCFRQFFLLIDYDEGLNVDALKEKQKAGRIIVKCFENMVIAFFYRGICNEALGKMSKAVEAYKQSEWICRKFLSAFQPEVTTFFEGLLKRALGYNKAVSDMKEYNEDKLNMTSHADKVRRLAEENETEERRKQKALLETIAKGEYPSRVARLDKTLQVINKMELKELDIFQSKRFPKSKMMTSTVHLIDYFLSESFQPMVKGMKTLELSCLDGDMTRKIKQKILSIEAKDDSVSPSKKIVRKRLFSPTLNSTNHTLLVSSKRTSIKSSPMHFSPDRVERIAVDVTYDKDYCAKKSYLERYNAKELLFHKSLLKSKVSEINDKPEDVNQQRVRNNAELFFQHQLLLSKERESKIHLRKFDSQKEYQVFGKENNLKNRMIKSLSTKSFKEYQRSLLQLRSSAGANKKRCFSARDSFDTSSPNKDNLDLIKKLESESNKIALIHRIHKKEKLRFSLKKSH